MPVALRCGSCQEPPIMADPNQRPGTAGGFLLALALTIGTIAGLLTGQPSIGFLIGLGIGSVIAVLLWLKGRG